MAERTVVLDEAVAGSEDALREATERAEKAEAELRKLKGGAGGADYVEPVEGVAVAGGEEELRKDSMMAHLLDSLGEGKDIGHYGRLVFAMVARHFLTHDEVLAYLCKDRDFSDEQARLMLKQVEGRDYNPPRRARLLEWQKEQEFPILPKPEDPDCGNVYRNLKFPDGVFAHIEEYREKKMEAGE